LRPATGARTGASLYPHHGNNLAGLLHSIGNDDGAEQLYRHVLGTQERLLGKNILKPLLREQSRSLALQKTRLCRCRVALPPCIGKQKADPWPDHPETLISTNNLAVSLQNKGDFAGAEQLYRHVLDAHERALGPEYPDTLTSVKKPRIAAREDGRLRKCRIVIPSRLENP